MCARSQRLTLDFTTYMVQEKRNVLDEEISVCEHSKSNAFPVKTDLKKQQRDLFDEKMKLCDRSIRTVLAERKFIARSLVVSVPA